MSTLPVTSFVTTFPWQIYLDVDVLLSPKDFVGLAPMSILCARLSSVWNPGVDDLDYPLVEEGACAGAVSGTWSARTAGDIISLFREFVSELLQVRRCLLERPLKLLAVPLEGIERSGVDPHEDDLSRSMFCL